MWGRKNGGGPQSDCHTLLWRGHLSCLGCSIICCIVKGLINQKPFKGRITENRQNMTHVAWPLSASTSQRLQTPRTGLHWGCVGQGRPEEPSKSTDVCRNWSASVSVSWMLFRLLSTLHRELSEHLSRSGHPVQFAISQHTCNCNGSK